jgi:IS4 transposase
MNAGKYVFSQLLSLVNRYEFDKCVARYSGDYHVRELGCWQQLAQLLFGQITARRGLRDICVCLNAHKEKAYHLGVGSCVSEPALSRANERRDWRIFADFGRYLMALVQPCYAACELPHIGTEGDIFALDSTTISVSLTLWKWAQGKYSCGAVKAHVLLNLRGSIPALVLVTDGRCHDVNALDSIAPIPCAIYVMDKAYVDFYRLYQLHQADAFFVVRAKENLVFRRVSSRSVSKPSGIRCDQTIRLRGKKTKKFYPEKLRRVKYFDVEKKVTLVFLTNNQTATSEEIVLLYKHRWDIESFFKWMKQHLQLKQLWGHSENAVNLHIWVAIIAYLLVAYLKVQVKSPLSVYEIEQILSISVFDKTPVNELLTEKQINQIFKEQPNLFSISE